MGIVQDMLSNTSQWTIDQERIDDRHPSGGGATANQGGTYPDLSARHCGVSGGEYGYTSPFRAAGESTNAAEPLSEAKPLSEAESLSAR